MGSIFYNIPFRTRSNDSDFTCKDGELCQVSGGTVYSEGEAVDISSGGYIDGVDPRPPVPDIDFGLVRTVLPGWHIHPDVYPSLLLAGDSGTLEYWTKIASGVLYRFQQEATWHSLFVSPFFAMACWRMSDGSYRSASNPVLLIPNSEVPLVSIEGDLTASVVEMRVTGAVCALWFRLRAPEVLRDWVGKIEALEILVSEPVQKYNTYEAFLPMRNVTTTAFCECLDVTTDTISRQRICTEAQKLAWRAVMKGANNLENTEVPSSLKFYPIYRVQLRDVDLVYKWTAGGEEGLGSNVYNTLTEGKNYSSLTKNPTTKSSRSATIVGEGKEITFATRPLKLSGAGEFKKIRKVFLRGNYSPQNLTIEVEGSRDMLQWWCISRRSGTTMTYLPQAQFRFYRLRVNGMLKEGETLEGAVFDER